MPRQPVTDPELADGGAQPPPVGRRLHPDGRQVFGCHPRGRAVLLLPDASPGDGGQVVASLEEEVQVLLLPHSEQPSQEGGVIPE